MREAHTAGPGPESLQAQHPSQAIRLTSSTSCHPPLVAQVRQRAFGAVLWGSRGQRLSSSSRTGAGGQAPFRRDPTSDSQLHSTPQDSPKASFIASVLRTFPKAVFLELDKIAPLSKRLEQWAGKTHVRLATYRPRLRHTSLASG